MFEDSSPTPVRTHAPETHARRRRSFARMSDQEMRAVFESLEPRLSAIWRTWWIRVAVAVVIVACVFILVASRTAVRFERSAVMVSPAGMNATQKSAPVSHGHAGDSVHSGWEASEDTGIAGAVKPAGSKIQN